MIALTVTVTEYDSLFIIIIKVARKYSCMASTTAINNAAASQLLTIN